MADGLSSTWVPEGAWADIASAGRTGRREGPPGLVVEPRENLALATMIVGAECAAALALRVKAEFDLDLPTRPRIATAAGMSLIWSGPGEWLALSESPASLVRLREIAADLAASSDQSAARAILRLSGPGIRDVLAKGCMIDLHPDAFAPGDVALTTIAHLGVQLWRPDDDVFELAVSRSYAVSLWSWLSSAAAEFGCEIQR